MCTAYGKRLISLQICQMELTGAIKDLVKSAEIVLTLCTTIQLHRLSSVFGQYSKNSSFNHRKTIRTTKCESCSTIASTTFLFWGDFNIYIYIVLHSSNRCLVEPHTLTTSHRPKSPPWAASASQASSNSQHLTASLDRPSSPLATGSKRG